MSRLSSLSARAVPYLSYVAVAVVAYGFALCPPSEMLRRIGQWLRQRQRRPSQLELAPYQLHDEQLSALAGTAYVPPLPEPVVQVLSRCCLCFLATTSDDSPHLSLMRFSFSPALDDSGAEVRGPRLPRCDRSHPWRVPYPFLALPAPSANGGWLRPVPLVRFWTRPH
jgi:hypothetical protein